MCGLTGFYDFNAQRRKSEQHKILQTMNDALLHRGPDQGGLWQDDKGTLNLGHRRLAIQDLSESGAQPMASHSGRFVIVYNGEIYNGLPLRRELEAKDVQFRGHSDTEIFLAGCEHWGVNQTLQKLTACSRSSCGINRKNNCILSAIVWVKNRFILAGQGKA